MPSNLNQYYNIPLVLTRDFLKWTHTHRLLDGPGEFQDELWAKKPLNLEFNFGGKYGTQFRTLQERESFDTEFDKLLQKEGIDTKHKNSLLYLIMFLGTDLQQQSIENNTYSHLQDYAKFLLDLIADSLAHIEGMRRNSKYQEVHDVLTDEIFFAKNHLVESMPYEELIEYRPDSKQADDVVKYLRISFYDNQLYIPNDIVLSIQSKSNRLLKSYEGTEVTGLQLPMNLEYEVFSFMIKKMLDLHKRHNTEFYQIMMKQDKLFSDFRDIINKNKKHTISNVKSLAKVGTLVTDYLLHHKIYTSKRQIATFLFEYFALFKAIMVKSQVKIPDEYPYLMSFYIKNGINSETIRNMMKDVGDI